MKLQSASPDHVGRPCTEARTLRPPNSASSCGVRYPTPVAFVSILIVNHNGKHFLDECLRSVAAQTYPAEHREVIVVDNGSSDGSAEHIRRHYPWVRLIEGE